MSVDEGATTGAQAHSREPNQITQEKDARDSDSLRAPTRFCDGSPGQHVDVLLICHHDQSDNGGDWARVRKMEKLFSMSNKSHVTIGFRGSFSTTPRGLLLAKSVSWLRALIGSIIRRKPDWVYVYNTTYVMVLLSLLKSLRLIRCKLVHDTLLTHELHICPSYISRFRKRLRRSLEALAVRKADWIFTPSNLSKRYFAKFNSNISSMPGPVDTEMFRPNLAVRLAIRERLGLTNYRVAGMVGPFDTFYNQSNLRWLSEHVDELSPAVKWLLIGRPSRHSLRSHPHILQIGEVDDYVGHLSAIDAFVIVRDDLTDGISNRILEAMSMGVPVFSNQAACWTEKSIIGSDSGLVVYEEDQLAVGINLVINDENRCVSIGANARKTAERYSLEAQIGEISRMLESGRR